MIWIRVFLLLSDPLFTFRRSSQGGIAWPKFPQRGDRLTIFGPEGPKNRRRRRRFRKFWQIFEKKWPKNAIKINFSKNFGFKNFFPDTPRESSRKRVFRGVKFFWPPIFCLFWVLSTRYLAIFSGSGGGSLDKPPFYFPSELSGGGSLDQNFLRGGIAWPFSGPKGPKIGAEGAVLENFGKFSKKSGLKMQ